MLASDRLRLPVTVERPESAPDYLLQWEDGSGIGVEVTEAGDASWQQWLTKTGDDRGPRLVHDRTDGFEGDEPERIVVRDLEEAIRRKAEKARNGAYDVTPIRDLLIYENSLGGLMADRNDVIKRVRQSDTVAARAGRVTFRQVHLIFGDDVCLDLLGQHLLIRDISQAHADDWSAWLAAQARYLRQRNFNAVDVDALAGELESLSRSDQRALRSHLRKLLAHLLKWQLQPSKRTKSWKNSISTARDDIESLFEENPSFENRLLAEIGSEYGRARRDAARDMKTDAERLPAECPFTVDQIRDPEYLPED
jgi:hypothetical protein